MPTEELLPGNAVVVHDDYDEDAFKEAQKLFPKLANMLQTVSATLPMAVELVADIFYTLYKPQVRLVNAESLTPSGMIARSIIEQATYTSQWEQIREQNTVGDTFNAGMATAMVGEGIIRKLDKKTKTYLRDLYEIEQSTRELFERAETYAEAAQQTPNRAEEFMKQAEAARAEAEKQQQEAEALAQQYPAMEEQVEDQTRQAAREAFEAASTEVESFNYAIAAFAPGGDEDGNGGNPNLTMKEKVSLARKVGSSAKVREVAELTGRMIRIALEKQRSKIDQPPTQLTGVHLGDEISRVLTSELSNLTDPVLEDVFYKRYIDRELSQYQMHGMRKEGRGPIICALDSSGSMAGGMGGAFSKEVWSKAISLALLAIARKERRDCAIIHFSGGSNLKVFHFVKGEASPHDLLATTEFFIGGGTTYEFWMEEALKLIEQSEYQKADTLIISDGEVSFTKETENSWNERRKGKEMRCISILLGYASGAQMLARISDALVTLDNLEKDGEALDAMFTI